MITPALPRHRAFTVMELLSIIGILAALLVLALGVLPRVTASSHATRCIGNLRQIGAIIHQYALDHNGEIVPTLDRSFNTTSGTVWFQTLHQAGVFESAGARPSWHLDPRGLFTCPSLQGRESGRERVTSANKIPSGLNASAYAYDAVQYGMMSTLAGWDNRRGWDAPSSKTKPEDLQPRAPLRLGQIQEPSQTPIVADSNFQYQLTSSRPEWFGFAHQGGCHFLYLDGSVRLEPRDGPYFSSSAP